MTRSAPVSSIRRSSAATSRGSCWPSASSWTATSYPRRRANLYPARIAPPTPRFAGRSRTSTPQRAATRAVWSEEPSFTTTTSASGSTSRTSRSTPGSASCSFHAGMISSRPRGEGEGMRGSLSTSVRWRGRSANGYGPVRRAWAPTGASPSLPKELPCRSTSSSRTGETPRSWRRRSTRCSRRRRRTGPCSSSTTRTPTPRPPTTCAGSTTLG
ncbi:Uncharacterised protein [Mycobacteroides abscessus]|nr:Uncharacterised protein [Mycobacteroides abscessus]